MRYRFGNWSVQRLSTAAWCLLLAVGSLLGGLLTESVNEETEWIPPVVGIAFALLFLALGAASVFSWSKNYVEVDSRQRLIRVATTRATHEFPASTTRARISKKPSMMSPGNLQLQEGSGEWFDVKAVGQGHLQASQRLTKLAEEFSAVGVDLEFV